MRLRCRELTAARREDGKAGPHRRGRRHAEIGALIAGVRRIEAGTDREDRAVVVAKHRIHAGLSDPSFVTVQSLAGLDPEAECRSQPGLKESARLDGEPDGVDRRSDILRLPLPLQPDDRAKIDLAPGAEQADAAALIRCREVEWVADTAKADAGQRRQSQLVGAGIFGSCLRAEADGDQPVGLRPVAAIGRLRRGPKQNQASGRRQSHHHPVSVIVSVSNRWRRVRLHRGAPAREIVRHSRLLRMAATPI